MEQDFKYAARLGSCLAKEYAKDMFRLLASYHDISASEAASRLNLHIRTAQDFLETMADLGMLSRVEVYERKRPYYRYSLEEDRIRLDLDLGALTEDQSGNARLQCEVRERKGGGAQFATAKGGNHISNVTTWTGTGRAKKARKINLTTPQGLFLYHLPFPTADRLTIEEIMRKADVPAEHAGEVLDLVGLLEEAGVLDFGS